MADSEPSYIDYEAFLDPDFSPAAFANTLVLGTNNANDTPLDLSTPLSKVLFDLQEIDTHIHTLTTKSALALVTYTNDQTIAARRILKEAQDQIALVTQGYERLEREVLRKWQAAEEARVAAENSLATLRLARSASRCITLGRQLESQLAEVTGRGPGVISNEENVSSGARDDLRALERAALTLLSLRRLFSASSSEDEGYGLDRVNVIRTIKSDLVRPAETVVKDIAQQAISRFSISPVTTERAGTTSSVSVSSAYKQARDARARFVSAINTLYLLSSIPKNIRTPSEFQPELLLSALQGFVHTAITSSVTALSRALSMLPNLERTLSDISARCQDLVAVEAILSNLRPPHHPLLTSARADDQDGQPELQLADEASGSLDETTLLQPLLQVLDTSSLPSYFWRSIASSLAGRVQEILNRGGVSARTLRSNKDRLTIEIRQCVLNGSQPSAVNIVAGRSRPGTESAIPSNWEREAAVMVSSVVSPLGR